ncbi:MAG: redoxin domain-containing protein [Myxococcota bacterium]|nr:redoxin domain-containing protein [Myxococcota bacterium]
MSLRDSAKEIGSFDTAWFMVSLDEPERNKAFAESVGADIVLLSDPTRKMAEEYGVLAPGGNYTRRWTFYIDQEGVVRKIDKAVEPAEHGESVARSLGELGLPKAKTATSADGSRSVPAGTQ